MDLKQYFRKIRELTDSIAEEYPLVVSLDTPDGGKAGRMSEVARSSAAKLIVEGRAVLASPQQRDEFEAKRAAQRKAAEMAEAARRIQVTVLPEADLQHFAGRRNSTQK